MATLIATLNTKITSLRSYLHELALQQKSNLQYAPKPGPPPSREELENIKKQQEREENEVATFSFKNQLLNEDQMTEIVNLFTQYSITITSTLLSTISDNARTVENDVASSSLYLFPRYLRFLDFTNSDLSSTSIHILFSYLLSLPGLYLSYLSFSLIPFSSSIPSFSALITAHTDLRIRHLDLSGCAIGDEGIAELVTIMSQAQRDDGSNYRNRGGGGEGGRGAGSKLGLLMETLNLNSNACGDSTVSALAAWFHSAQGCSLTSLSLANNYITDTGITILSVALSKSSSPSSSASSPAASNRLKSVSPGLRYLDLRSNSLSSVGLICLRDAIRSGSLPTFVSARIPPPSLLYLHVSDNRTSILDREKQITIEKELETLVERNREERRRRKKIAILQGFHSRIGKYSSIRVLKDYNNGNEFGDRSTWWNEVFSFVGEDDF